MGVYPRIVLINPEFPVQMSCSLTMIYSFSYWGASPPVRKNYQKRGRLFRMPLDNESMGHLGDLFVYPVALTTTFSL